MTKQNWPSRLFPISLLFLFDSLLVSNGNLTCQIQRVSLVTGTGFSRSSRSIDSSQENHNLKTLSSVILKECIILFLTSGLLLLTCSLPAFILVPLLKLKFLKFLIILKLFKPIPILETPAIPDPCRNVVLLENMVNWNDAVQECRSLGKELVTVESRAKFDCLVDAIRNSGLPNGTIFWTGGNDIQMEGDFVWISSGDGFDTFYPPGTGQPDNTGGNPGEDCVSMRYFTNDPNYYIMNDEDCNIPISLICE